MQKIVKGIFLSNNYLGVDLGVVVAEDDLLLIDSPIYLEDGQEWLESLKTFGQARFLALLDYHPDRVIGARGFNIPSIAHDATRIEMSTWSDNYKGVANPIGADVDQLRRVTGIRKAIPELTFSDKMTIQFGERLIEFWHRPGPTQGTMWVVLPENRVVFVGDTVMVGEPPFIGEADIDSWMESLDELRSSSMKSYKIVTSHDGVIRREHLNHMARFLRKLPRRIERLSKRGDVEENALKSARELTRDYKLSPEREELVQRRLQVGLTRIYARLHPAES
jgi:cyclase